MAPRVRADVTETTEESFDELIGVNLKGPYFLTQLVANHWLKNPTPSAIPSGPEGRLRHLGLGEHGLDRARRVLHLQAGLAMASLLWATRLAPEGIQVIEFRPGIMMTDMTSVVKDKYDKLIAEGLVPQKRWGIPTTWAAPSAPSSTATWDSSSGAVIDIDGGLQIRRL